MIDWASLVITLVMLAVLAPLGLYAASRGGTRSPLAPLRPYLTAAKQVYVETPLRVITGRYRVPDKRTVIPAARAYCSAADCPGHKPMPPGIPPTQCRLLAP